MIIVSLIRGMDMEDPAQREKVYTIIESEIWADQQDLRDKIASHVARRLGVFES